MSSDAHRHAPLEAPIVEGRSATTVFHRLMQGAIITVVVALCVNHIAGRIVRGPLPLSFGWATLWYSLFAGQCAALIWLSTRRGRTSSQRRYLLVILLALASMLCMSLLLGVMSNQTILLFMVMLWFVALRLPLRPTILFALCLGFAFPFVRYLLPGYSLWRLVIETFLTWGFSGFVISAAFAIRSETEAEKRLVRQQLDLLSAQALLQQSERLAERVRLSQELHDSIGHHLTALSLQLETARHLVPDSERPILEQAQESCRATLRELREVVGSLREVRPMDFQQFLQNLSGQVSSPRIHVTFSGEIPFQDSERNHALLRGVQELVTNTLKHAEARNLWIEVACSLDSVYLVLEDDGQGAPDLVEGHGLKGLRERIRALGGRLDLRPGPPGFQARVWIPRAETAP